MESGIRVRGGLRRHKLNPNQYLLTLLDEAAAAELILPTETQAVQIQVLELLRRLSSDYTYGESSSIPVETGEKLLLSILYTLDASLLDYASAEDALEALKSVPLKELYATGQRRIASCLAETHTRFEHVHQTRLSTHLIAYNDTIGKGIPGFFKTYTPRFHANETPADIDYQLAVDVVNITGIFYMERYIGRLSLENDFCRLFDADEVEQLLFSYGRTYRLPYADSLLNIYDVVLTNALFSTLLGRSAGTLSISAGDCALLDQRLRRVPASGMAQLLQSGLKRLLEGLGVSEPVQHEYALVCTEQIKTRLVHALEVDHLPHLVIIDQESSNPSFMLLSQDIQMNNEDLRQLIGNILACQSGQEKAALIMRSVHSQADFLEILAADCLFDDEYETLYASLSPLEIALLLEPAAAEALREEDFSLAGWLSRTAAESSGWESGLIAYMKSLPYAAFQAVEAQLQQFVTGLL